MSNVVVIEWNIGYNAKPEAIYEKLSEYMDGCFVFVLLEVVPKAYEFFSEAFKGNANIDYSLCYRKPGKYDGKGRKLGVMIATSLDITVLDTGVFDRTLLPDRTLFSRLKIGEKTVKIAALHSITGCSHLVSKSLNFCSFAESIEEFCPDIVVMDANEPKVDHYDIEKMQFFDKNGKGARVLFTLLKDLGLKDAYAFLYDKDKYVEGRPLAVSHMINGKMPVRYDFIFTNSKKLGIESMEYDYEDAVKASADHAISIAKVSL